MLQFARQRIDSLLRSLGSLLPGRPSSHADRSRVIRLWREDARQSYPVIGLTPSRLLALLQAADAGMPQSQFELFSDMLAKWPRLAAVEATRRLALTGLDWEIVAPPPSAIPASSDLARQAADLCTQTLTRLDGFRAALDHLAGAIGFGLAVVELIWERGALVDLVPVPNNRLLANPDEPWRLRVLTEEETTRGVALDEFPNKWIVHRPRGAAGRPFEGGLLRGSALLFLAQNQSFKDWLIFSEIAGSPVRIAQFDPGASEVEKRKLLETLAAIGRDAVAVISKNVDVKVLDAAGRNAQPYEALQNYCNTEVTILWLGQHLTTDIRQSGSRAAAEIHDRVREDLLVADIADEGRTIRRDLLRPLVQSRFGAHAPLPQFRRSLIQSVDTRVLADTLAVAVNQIGLRVPRRWAHQALGIPEPQGAEPTLTTGASS